MDLVHGGGERWGCTAAGRPPSLQLTSTEGGMRLRLQPRPEPASQRLQLASRPPRPSDGGQPRRASPPYPDEWGWGEALAELGLRIRVPVEAQQRGSRPIGLSSVGVTGNTR
ncbi:hypothetical protein I79_011617 [Cricetulus griseus]|uniref:Uncharacterized protein n=1 Tax=Cricetulus griseus TaxID=10029 RepID=G3HLM8_CRIGR|nr:hypothetical protein I79_011617 [Cricetulus griseus]